MEDFPDVFVTNNVELEIVSATASGSAKQQVTRREPQPGET
jgi:hypothetical protein